MLIIISVILKSLLNINNVIAKCVILSIIISFISDNALRTWIPGTPLGINKFIVFLHTFSAYNSLPVQYKVYSLGSMKCLCTSWRYSEAYENISIDLALCRKNPIKNKLVIPNCHPVLLGENYTETKVLELKLA